MENITLGQIAGAIALLATIVGAFVTIYKFITSHISNRFNKVEKRLDILEEKDKKQDKEIEESKEERHLLLQAQLACLKGLQEQGCNGPVTQSINDIEKYLMKKTHE